MLPFLKSKKSASVSAEVRTPQGEPDAKAAKALEHATNAIQSIANNDSKGLLDSMQALHEHWNSQTGDDGTK